MRLIPHRFLVIVGEEMSVHIFSLQIASVVADHYSVGIDHR